MADELFLSKTDGRPMYLQIMEQIKLRIYAGDWPSGHSLPSIRELAASTKVSVITVKRAYMELEHEGLIVTRHGRGSFVADLHDMQSDLRDEEINQQIEDLLDAASKLGIEGSALLEKVEAALSKRANAEED
jgi:GntR family transcriptional regulator